MPRMNWNGSTESASDVNASFYSASPANYLGRRLQNLIARTAKPALLDEMLGDGVEIDGRRINMGMGNAAPSEVDERFSTIESLILTYHATETLLRLYFAHESLPTCPWAKLVSIRNSDFWNLLERRFVRETPIDALERIDRVFFGADLPDSLIQAQRGGNDSRNLEILMWRYAHYVKEMKDAYNSAKHGLSLNAFSLNLAVEGPFPVKRKGRVVASLAFGPVRGQRKEWHENVAYVDLPENVARVDCACRLVSQMWRIGRARYLATPTSHLDTFSTPRLEDIFSDEGAVSSFRLGLH